MGAAMQGELGRLKESTGTCTKERMDLSKEWAEFQRQAEVVSIADEQDELQAQVTRLMVSTSAALQQLHNHRRIRGQQALVPFKAVADLSFWMELLVATEDVE